MTSPTLSPVFFFSSEDGEQTSVSRLLIRIKVPFVLVGRPALPAELCAHVALVHVAFFPFSSADLTLYLDRTPAPECDSQPGLWPPHS